MEYYFSMNNSSFIPNGIINVASRPPIGAKCVFLKFVDQKSDKFWAAFPDGDAYLVVWGKNNRSPHQSQRVVDEYEINRRFEEKLHKGYFLANGNPLLYFFQNNHSWFSKLDVSAGFANAILAHKLDGALVCDDSNLKNKKLIKI